MTVAKKRYETIDFIRGFALINMFFYHGIYDLVFIFNLDIPWFTTKGAYFWQQMICILFIVIAGVSVNFSRNLFLHGLKVFGGGLIISLTTIITMPSQFVSFGILHFMGLSMILLFIIKKYLDKVSPLGGFVISMLLFIMMKRLPSGYLGVGDISLLPLPTSLYQSDYLYAFGFPNSRFTSADYFPILPWFFLFIAGYFLWNILENNRYQKKWKNEENSIQKNSKDQENSSIPKNNMKENNNAPENNDVLEKYGHFHVKGINYLGSHTLLFYLLHQPFLYSIIFLLLNIYPLLNG